MPPPEVQRNASMPGKLMLRPTASTTHTSMNFAANDSFRHLNAPANLPEGVRWMSREEFEAASAAPVDFKLKLRNGALEPVYVRPGSKFAAAFKREWHRLAARPARLPARNRGPRSHSARPRAATRTPAMLHPMDPAPPLPHSTSNVGRRSGRASWNAPAGRGMRFMAARRFGRIR